MEVKAKPISSTRTPLRLHDDYQVPQSSRDSTPHLAEQGRGTRWQADGCRSRPYASRVSSVSREPSSSETAELSDDYKGV